MQTDVYILPISVLVISKTFFVVAKLCIYFLTSKDFSIFLIQPHNIPLLK